MGESRVVIPIFGILDVTGEVIESYVTECAYGGSACPTGEDRDMHGDSGRTI